MLRSKATAIDARRAGFERRTKNLVLRFRASGLNLHKGCTGLEQLPVLSCQFSVSLAWLGGSRQFLNQVLKIGWEFAIHGDNFSGARMDKFQMGGVKSYASDEWLGCFFAIVFSVANYAMAGGEELRSDLILESGDEFYADQRSIGKHLLDAIAQFGA
jgi:hypothetical protein